jgi:hypothetical protein
MWSKMQASMLSAFTPPGTGATPEKPDKPDRPPRAEPGKRRS